MLRRLALAAILAMAAGPAAAGPAGDRLFETGVFAAAQNGALLRYTHTRTGEGDADLLRSISEGAIRLELTEGADGVLEARVRMTADGRARDLHPFPASAGNPLLMTFLESSLRSMARITGGSIFYIRNRMKEALRDGGEITSDKMAFGERVLDVDIITFRPFEGDRNAQRMGDFAGLELSFVMSTETPGAFLRLSADTAPGAASAAFREVIALETMEQP